MNHEQALQRVGQANPLPPDSDGPDGFLSMTALLDRIDGRSTNMQTQARPVESVERETTVRRRRRLIPIVAGAVAVAVVGVALWLFLADDEPDVIINSPLGVVQALEEATLSGNQQLERTYYADEAVLALITPDDEFEIALGDPVEGDNSLSDWDADGVITFFDVILQDGARVHAAGVSDLLDCSAAGENTVVCDERLQGSPFLEPGNHDVTQTFTVVDGLITRHVVDMLANAAEPFGTAEVLDYEAWVRQNRPDESMEQLFPGSPGEFIVTPETVDTHRSLIAEWQDQS
ncbi:MAG: hypothetical protein HKO70_13070 [Acidimicrobiia bacterium]|nr:hypothetical protein [Acidimicrobiia bacterium]